jgi:TATA-box binding protein (TBP) (component of TFIID and TFIIIB)
VKNEQEYNEKDVHVIETLQTYKIQDIRTVMIHGVYAHPRRINRLEAFKLLQAQNFNVKYDPKLHNALNIRFVNDTTGKTGDGSFLIFESGKIIITGERSVEKYETRFNEIMNVIETVACYDL